MGCSASSNSYDNVDGSNLDSGSFAPSVGGGGNGNGEDRVGSAKDADDLVCSDLDARGRTPVITRLDSAADVAPVGASAPAQSLRDRMAEGRGDIKRTQDKLSMSLNTPLVDRERTVLESGSWLHEHKDLNHKRSVLPPIATGKAVTGKGMAFTVD